jgi:hypothetical protein
VSSRGVASCFSMAFLRVLRLSGGLMLGRVASALVANSSAPAVTSASSFSFPVPSGYSTQVYNVSAATTTIAYDYSNEQLALLWDQVGPISVGPITTTVSPTPEPSSYPRPGSFHPQVSHCSYICNIADHDRFQHTIHLLTVTNCLTTSFGG